MYTDIRKIIDYNIKESLYNSLAERTNVFLQDCKINGEIDMEALKIAQNRWRKDLGIIFYYNQSKLNPQKFQEFDWKYIKLSNDFGILGLNSPYHSRHEVVGNVYFTIEYLYTAFNYIRGKAERTWESPGQQDIDILILPKKSKEYLENDGYIFDHFPRKAYNNEKEIENGKLYSFKLKMECLKEYLCIVE